MYIYPSWQRACRRTPTRGVEHPPSSFVDPSGKLQAPQCEQKRPVSTYEFIGFRAISFNRPYKLSGLVTPMAPNQIKS